MSTGTMLIANPISVKKVKDLSGMTFGRLTAVRLSTDDELSDKQRASGRSCWLCECECGETTAALAKDLKSGNTKSCGCQSSRLKKGYRHCNFVDMTGRVFGRLTVVRMATEDDLSESQRRNKGNLIYWVCDCECGNDAVVYGALLRKGNTASCGCLHRSIVSGRNNYCFRDLVGETFGRLTVLRLANKDELPERKRNRTHWVCSCSCGSVKAIASNKLTCGKTVSCGCYNLEMSIGKNNHFYNHEMTDDERFAPKRLAAANWSMEMKWRKAVLAERGEHCQILGSSCAEVTIHHLSSYKHNHDLRFVVSNGFVIDRRLHAVLHGVYGVNTSSDQMDEFSKRINALSSSSLNNMMRMFYRSDIDGRTWCYTNNKSEIFSIIGYDSSLAKVG